MKNNNNKKLAILAIIGGLGIGFYSFATSNDYFGSRRNEGVYHFEFNNQPATLIREDMRFDRDNYFIELGVENRISEGQILSDEGILVRVVRSGHDYELVAP